MTYDPHRKEPRFSPLFLIIHSATLMFSPPLSPLPREGTPCFSTALRNRSNTVDDRLLLQALILITCYPESIGQFDQQKLLHTVRQYPSTIP
jgi:hypothetical protein